jgi:5-formyltetrahydrofolate cyclo-ligase
LIAEPDKDALRGAARARRRALQAAAPDAGERAAARFPEDLIGALDSAALYWPARSEIDPRPLGRRLAAAGVRLALPAVVAPGAPLAFRAWRDGDALAPDVLGLPAPPFEAAAVRPDLVVVPLLAFDTVGGRLGQGGGYYDRTLAQLRAGGPVFILGLAYAGQEAARLPAETHDQPLDAVLTEAGFRPFG